MALDFGGLPELYAGRQAVIRLDLATQSLDGPAYMYFGPSDDNFEVHKVQMNVGFGFCS